MFLEHTSSGKPGVRICVHKKLHLEQVSNLLGIEGQDPFEEHHVRRIDGDRLLFPAKQRSRRVSRERSPSPSPGQVPALRRLGAGTRLL